MFRRHVSSCFCVFSVSLSLISGATNSWAGDRFPSYRLTDGIPARRQPTPLIGAAIGLSNDRSVAFDSNSSNPTQAYVVRRGQFESIPTLPLNNLLLLNKRSTAINAVGDVFGYELFGGGAVLSFIYRANGTMVELRPPASDGFVTPTFANSAGQILGTGRFLAPFLWQNGSWQAILKPSVIAISETGHIIGAEQINGQNFGFVLREGVASQILPPPGYVSSVPTAISADGLTVVGTTHPESQPFGELPYLWRNGQSSLVPLPLGFNSGRPTIVLADGSIIGNGNDQFSFPGKATWIFTQGQSCRLVDLLDEESSSFIKQIDFAVGANQRDEILARADSPGPTYILTASSEAGGIVSEPPRLTFSGANDALELTVVPRGNGPFTFEWYEDFDLSPRTDSGKFTGTSTGTLRRSASGSFPGERHSYRCRIIDSADVLVSNRSYQVQTVYSASGHAPLVLNDYSVPSESYLHGDRVFAFYVAAPDPVTVTWPPALLAHPKFSFTSTQFSPGVIHVVGTIRDFTGIEGLTFGQIILSVPSGEREFIGLSDLNVVQQRDVRLANLSTRLRVGAGDEVGIVGFVVKAAKRVLIRALGPGLEQYGVSNVLANPTIELHGPNGLIQFNDDWSDRQGAQIAATGLSPSFSSESAILVSLPIGNYTAIVRGVGGTTGNALLELYNLDSLPGVPFGGAAELVNLSTRGRVETGDSVMIGGFVVSSGNAKRYLIRAIGPSLAAYGVQGALQNPTVQLFRGSTLIAENDDWRSTQMADITASGFAPVDNRESAIFATLESGSYTAVVRGAGDTSGVGLVEVYELP